VKVIITGSSGYVGNFLSEHFAGLGWSVVGCDLRPLDRQAGLKSFTFRPVDVSDATAVHAFVAAERPEVIVHLAYLMEPQHDSAVEERVDVQGSMHVLAAADAVASVRQLLFFSSTSAYGAREDNPLWIDESRPLAPNDYVYGIHKKTIEERYAREKKRRDLKLVIVRMCTAVGPSYFKPGGVVSSFTRAPFAPMLGGEDTKLQWIHEDDVKALVEKLVSDDEVEGTFNLVPDSYTCITEMAAFLDKKTLKIPVPLFRGIVRILWTLHLGSTAPPMVRLMTYGIVASADKLQKHYGYTFKYDALGAFKDAVEKRRQNGTL
jgi:UDP-glucose 4-epimerase